MSQTIFPTQNRYNDPYHQRVTNYGSIYNQKYLSRASNEIIKAFGNNMIIKGLQVTPTFLNSIATLDFTPGLLIHDLTLIEITAITTLNCNISALGDTPTTGSHLVVFTDFQYVETPDLDSQNQLKLSVYHVNGAGTVVTAFAGSPAFSATRNKVIVSILNFTKSGVNIVSCTESTPVIVDGKLSPISILGVNYYLKGLDSENINSWDILSMFYNNFLNEFMFHDR